MGFLPFMQLLALTMWAVSGCLILVSAAEQNAGGCLFYSGMMFLFAINYTLMKRTE